MFKRVRQLEISLAAKCQLLFGLAVVLIIAAALFVPGQRMEQLMEQLNESAAETVVRQTMDEHILRFRSVETAAREFESFAALPPTTRPVTIDDRTYLPPRLLLVKDPIDPDRLLRWERSAIRRLRDRPQATFDARYGEEGTRYRYVRVDAGCVKCHGASASATAVAASTQASGAGRSAATQPVYPPLALVSVEIPSQIQANQLLLNRVFIIAAGLLAGTLAIVTFYLITTRLILQPVRVLRETAEKVSEGDLNVRSDISTGDEFEQLSATFNTMLANLKQSDDQLRAVNKSLDLRLGQLAESNVALYESNRLKSEFLANVSHELRTPLNSILGFAELLRDFMGSPAEPKTQRYVQNILTSGNNLLDLINDLLDLAKIEAGKMEVRSEPISLADLLEALTSILKPLVEAKRLQIVPTVAADVPIVSTDPAKLQQILYNFLSNAIKFSPTGERIELTAAVQEQSKVRITVRDFGPGIDPAQQGMIFEKFRQLDGSATRNHGGTGLGLSISKELAGLLGGTIGVDSAAGAGATFWIALPVKIESGSKDVRHPLAVV